MRAASPRLLLATIGLAVAGADRQDETCEACGLLVWRMQSIVATKQQQLEGLKATKEKRAKKSTKAHSKRWIKQEYAVELAGAIETQIDGLATDQRIQGSACRMNHDNPIQGSALRAELEMTFHPERCRERVKKRIESVLEDFQDELVGLVVAGKGAGTACAQILDDCSKKRATLLLGVEYREDMNPHELDRLQPGYSDSWTLHKDVDDSVYWFNKARMKSVKEPPPGWMKTADGATWEYKPNGNAHGHGHGHGQARKDEV